MSCRRVGGVCVSGSHCFHGQVTEGWDYLGNNILFCFTVKLSRISGIQDEKTNCCYCLCLEQYETVMGFLKCTVQMAQKVTCYGTSFMILLYSIPKLQHSYFTLNIIRKIKSRNNLNFLQIM